VIVGVPKEIKSGEQRVAGTGSGIRDEDFARHGAAPVLPPSHDRPGRRSPGD
jgi:alanine dehydrogenase